MQCDWSGWDLRRALKIMPMKYISDTFSHLYRQICCSVRIRIGTIAEELWMSFKKSFNTPIHMYSKTATWVILGAKQQNSDPKIKTTLSLRGSFGKILKSTHFGPIFLCNGPKSKLSGHLWSNFGNKNVTFCKFFFKSKTMAPQISPRI